MFISFERCGRRAARELRELRDMGEMRREILEMFSLEGLGEKMIQSG